MADYSNVGRPIVDIANYEFRTNPFKMSGGTMYGENPWKSDDFESAHDELRFKLAGVTEIDAFKMGRESFAYAAGEDEDRAAQLRASWDLVGAARKGNPKAKKKVKAVTKAAAKGHPAAKAAVKDMRKADTAQRAISKARKPKRRAQGHAHMTQDKKHPWLFHPRVFGAGLRRLRADADKKYGFDDHGLAHYQGRTTRPPKANKRELAAHQTPRRGKGHFDGYPTAPPVNEAELRKHPSQRSGRGAF